MLGRKVGEGMSYEKCIFIGLPVLHFNNDLGTLSFFIYN